MHKPPFTSTVVNIYINRKTHVKTKKAIVYATLLFERTEEVVNNSDCAQALSTVLAIQAHHVENIHGSQG